MATLSELDNLSLKQLLQKCESLGINTDDVDTKQDILNLIMSHQQHQQQGQEQQEQEQPKKPVPPSKPPIAFNHTSLKPSAPFKPLTSMSVSNLKPHQHSVTSLPSQSTQTQAISPRPFTPPNISNPSTGTATPNTGLNSTAISNNSSANPTTTTTGVSANSNPMGQMRSAQTSSNLLATNPLARSLPQNNNNLPFLKPVGAQPVRPAIPQRFGQPIELSHQNNFEKPEAHVNSKMSQELNVHPNVQKAQRPLRRSLSANSLDHNMNTNSSKATMGKLNLSELDQIDKDLTFSFKILNTVPVKSSTEKQFTAYVVQILDNGGTERTILKRYRQFDELFTHIKKYVKENKECGNIDNLPKFPSKKLIGNIDPEFVLKRCSKLESWLNAIINLPGAFHQSWMTEFMELKELPTRHGGLFKSQVKRGDSFRSGLNRSGSALMNSKEGLSSSSPNTQNLAESGETVLRGGGADSQAVVAPNSPQQQPANASVDTMKLIQERLKQLALNPTSFSLRSANLAPKEIELCLSSVKGYAIKITHMDLAENALLEMPAGLLLLPNIESLDLSTNEIAKLRTIGFVQNPGKLKVLDMSCNPLSFLPNDIDRASNLVTLRLSCCELIELPDEITRLANLEVLDLSHNALTELPATIADLASLKTVNLAQNQLADLPLSMGLCKNLATLNLKENPLDEEIAGAYKQGHMELLHLLQLRVRHWEKESPWSDNPSQASKLGNVANRPPSRFPPAPTASSSGLNAQRPSPTGFNTTNNNNNPTTHTNNAATINNTNNPADNTKPSALLRPRPDPLKNSDAPVALPTQNKMAPDPAHQLLNTPPKKSISVPVPSFSSDSDAHVKDLKPSTRPILAPKPDLANNLSSSSLPAPPQPLEEKVVMIRDWAVKEIDNTILPQLAIVKQSVTRTTSLESCKQITSQVRTLSTTFDQHRKFNFWIRVENQVKQLPAPPAPDQSGGSLQQVQSVLLSLLSGIERILNAIKVVLDTSTIAQELVNLVRVVKDFREALKKF